MDKMARPSKRTRAETLDDLFDRLKNTEDYVEPAKKSCNEDIAIQSEKKDDDFQKKKGIDIYNFTSESEDNDFQEKEDIEIGASSSTKVKPKPRYRGGTAKSQYINSHESSDDESNAHPKREVNKRTLTKVINKKMVDERMRLLKVSESKRSVIEPKNLEETKEPEPTHRKPSMETSDIELNTENQTNLEKNTNKQNKSTDRTLRKRKNVNINESVANTREMTLSPVFQPFIKHTAAVRKNSIAIPNKEKDLCQADQAAELIDLTQNLLSDSELVHNSPPKLNGSQEINKCRGRHSKLEMRFESDGNKASQPTPAKRRKRSNTLDGDDNDKKGSTNISKPKTTIMQSEMIQISPPISISIDTMEKSPITAHGVADESPPKAKGLSDKIEGRSLKTGDLSPVSKNFYGKLMKTAHFPNDGLCSPHSNKSDSSISLEYNLDCEESNLEYRTYTILSNADKIKDKSSHNSKNNTDKKDKLTIFPIKLAEKMMRLSRKEMLIPSSSKAGCQGLNRYTAKKLSGQNSKGNIPNILTITATKPVCLNLRERKVKDKVSITKLKAMPKLQNNKSNCEEHNTHFETSPSANANSSVDEWFAKNELAHENKAHDTINATFIDKLNDILEKINLTLSEANHTTLKNCVGMFIDIEKALQERGEEEEKKRSEIINRTMSEITEHVRAMVTKLAELDSERRENDRRYMKSTLKEKAKELTHAEYTKRRALVRLLKEDIQGVSDLINRVGNKS